MKAGKETSGNWKNWVIGILIVVVLVMLFYKPGIMLSLDPPNNPHLSNPTEPWKWDEGLYVPFIDPTANPEVNSQSQTITYVSADHIAYVFTTPSLTNPGSLDIYAANGDNILSVSNPQDNADASDENINSIISFSHPGDESNPTETASIVYVLPDDELDTPGYYSIIVGVTLPKTERYPDPISLTVDVNTRPGSPGNVDIFYPPPPPN